MPPVPGVRTNGFCHISRDGIGVNEIPIKVLLGQGNVSCPFHASDTRLPVYSVGFAQIPPSRWR